MRARLVSVIEVSSGGVRRYFTTEGESIGAGPEGAAAEERILAPERLRRQVLEQAADVAASMGCDDVAQRIREIVGDEPIVTGYEPLPEPTHVTPISVADVIASVPKRRRIAPPFDPVGAPKMTVERGSVGGEEGCAPGCSCEIHEEGEG